MAAQTKAISNNCVSEIKVPQSVENAYGVDYNPVLVLYATFDYDVIVSVWNPVSGKVVAKFRGFGENFLDVLFVPGNRLAVSSSEVHHGGCIRIFNLGEVESNEAEFVKDDEGNDREGEGNVKENEDHVYQDNDKDNEEHDVKDNEEDDDKDKDEDDDEDDEKDDKDDEDDDEEDEDDYEDSKADLEIDEEDIPITYPGPMALSPSGNILTTEAFNDGGPSVFEIFIDWDNLKFLKWKEIIPGECSLLCCSRDFKVTMYSYKWPFLSSAKVCMNSEGEVHIQDQEKVTYYILNGEEKQIDKDVRALVHDGENLIIANKHDVLLLESINEGSTAHLVASDVEPLGLRLNHEGQLIVCEKKAIKLFEYKCNPRSLQNLCRGHLRKFIQSSYTDKVNSLKIPYMLKKYLLFQ